MEHVEKEQGPMRLSIVIPFTTSNFKTGSRPEGKAQYEKMACKGMEKKRNWQMEGVR